MQPYVATSGALEEVRIEIVLRRRIVRNRPRKISEKLLNCAAALGSTGWVRSSFV